MPLDNQRLANCFASGIIGQPNDHCKTASAGQYRKDHDDAVVLSLRRPKGYPYWQIMDLRPYGDTLSKDLLVHAFKTVEHRF